MSEIVLGQGIDCISITGVNFDFEKHQIAVTYEVGSKVKTTKLTFAMAKNIDLFNTEALRPYLK